MEVYSHKFLVDREIAIFIDSKLADHLFYKNTKCEKLKQFMKELLS